jgi:hypothetical protein
MPQKHTFKAKILNAGGGAAFVEVPIDVEKAFGEKRPKLFSTNYLIPINVNMCCGLMKPKKNRQNKTEF